MSSPSIPMHMTIGKAPFEGAMPGAQLAIIGPELTREMLHYLDHRWNPEERLEQLREIDPRVHCAYTLSRGHLSEAQIAEIRPRVFRVPQPHGPGYTTAQIAAAMRVSPQTAQRLVRAGESFLAPEEWRQARADDMRLAWLRVHAPDVSTVLELREYGYRQEQIAEMQRLTLLQVKGLAKRGQAVMGDSYWRAVRRRRRQVHEDNREEVPTEVIAERMREREAAAKQAVETRDDVSDALSGVVV